MTRVDLDKLQKVFDANPGWHDDNKTSRIWFKIPSLIAELRAARGCVESLRALEFAPHAHNAECQDCVELYRRGLDDLTAYDAATVAGVEEKP